MTRNDLLNEIKHELHYIQEENDRAMEELHKNVSAINEVIELVDMLKESFERELESLKKDSKLDG